MLEVLLVLNLVFYHPFHVSVCEIAYDQEDKALEITHRIFLDDMENALREYHDLTQFDITRPTENLELNELLRAYFNENFKIKVNEEPLKYEFLGFELEKDVIYAYLQVVNLTSFNDLEVFNTILIQMFDDQENLVHVKKRKKIKTLRLNRGHFIDKVTF
ncbi:MAG TPA: DUF6702 family protein [Cyclobacteriaceae bacterium]